MASLGRTVPRHRFKVCCRLYKYNPAERLFPGSSCLCVCPRGDGLPGGSRTHWEVGKRQHPVSAKLNTLSVSSMRFKLLLCSDWRVTLRASRTNWTSWSSFAKTSGQRSSGGRWTTSERTIRWTNKAAEELAVEQQNEGILPPAPCWYANERFLCSSAATGYLRPARQQVLSADSALQWEAVPGSGSQG